MESRTHTSDAPELWDLVSACAYAVGRLQGLQAHYARQGKRDSRLDKHLPNLMKARAYLAQLEEEQPQ